MKFEPKWLEKELDKDYFGFEPSYIDGEGVRKRKEEENEREPENKITITKGDDPEMLNEFDDLGEAIESYIEEKCEPEFYELEKNLSETNRKVLIEAINILNRYKKEIAKNPELKTSLLTLARFLGFGAGYPYPEPYGVKKSLDLEKSEPVLFNWKTFIENAEENIEEKEQAEEDFEKSDSDPFPTLTKSLLAGQRKRDIAKTKQDLDSGRRFI